jgi:hypothetical protein
MSLQRVVYLIVVACLLVCNVVCAAQIEVDQLLGKEAPAFTLPAHIDKSLSLSDFIGKKVVILAFYPKDFTGG